MNIASTALCLAFLTLMIGLRYRVGTDWWAYERVLYFAYELPLNELLARGDPGYRLINWLVAQLGAQSWLINLISALIFAVGLIRFCSAQRNPTFALAAALPYLVLVVAMGYQRQAAAIGLIMYALVDLFKGNYLRYVLFTVVAATFHKTAALMIPLAIISINKNKFILYPAVAIAAYISYVTLLAPSVDSLLENYVVAGYESQGTLIRLAMSLLPVYLLYTYRDRINVESAEYGFWRMIGVLVIAGSVLFFSGVASTAIDRIALYFIPLQLFVYSRLDQLLAIDGRSTSMLVYGYALSVMTVWLVFAAHSRFWLPYEVYPLF